MGRFKRMVNVSAYEIIKDLAPVSTIRIIAQAKDDDLLRAFFAFIVCETAGGLREIPTKQHRTDLARICYTKGMDKKRIMEVLKVSKATLKRIKHETN